MGRRYGVSVSVTRRILLSCLGLTLFAVGAEGTPIADVRTAYLVPSDRTYNRQYELGIINAFADLQGWYAGELGGPTFVLHDPIVEVYNTPHASTYYSTNPSGPADPFVLWFWANTIADAFSLTGASFNDPDHAWIFYIDAEPAAGQIGGAGTSGVAVLPEHDLRGLIGADPQPVSRWIGGLGHELGHAFGLPHPPACEAGGPACPMQALMWLGYITYPDAFLLPEDKATLFASRFIAEPPELVPEPATGLLVISNLLGVALGRVRRRRSRFA
jgi:hypothetical protein